LERLKERIAIADKALASFIQIMQIAHPSSIERDAAIQRFEYTFETVWKAAKQMLFDLEGINEGSPKGVIRSCHEIGILDEVETANALHMVNDHNLTVHTYNESLATEIYERFKYYVTLLRIWLERIKVRPSKT
jgi:nucleotidyltransferase substrate binding protein (TIGR01987 family)